MNKKEILKQIVEDFGAYALSSNLNLEYEDLKEKSFANNSNYRDKITEKGLDIILDHPEFKNHILPLVFALENNNLMRAHEDFIINKTRAYDNLFILMGEEDSINKIFKLSSPLMSDTDQSWTNYRNQFVDFLSVVIDKSKSSQKIKEMFNDFNEIQKSDKTDFFPLVKSFLDKRVLADKVYESIESLNNAYLETRLVDYLHQNGIAFSFKLKSLEMFELEEKIVFEKIIKFNTNYFMKMGIEEDKVLMGLEKFSELICNKENIFYLNKKKDKTFTLVLRSTNEKTVNTLYNDIKQYSPLIKEFIQGFDGSEEYIKRFSTYWYLNTQLSPKSSSVKTKI